MAVQKNTYYAFEIEQKGSGKAMKVEAADYYVEAFTVKGATPEEALSEYVNADHLGYFDKNDAYYFAVISFGNTMESEHAIKICKVVPIRKLEVEAV